MTATERYAGMSNTRPADHFSPAHVVSQFVNSTLASI
jgi:hypothetical protein